MSGPRVKAAGLPPTYLQHTSCLRWVRWWVSWRDGNGSFSELPGALAGATRGREEATLRRLSGNSQRGRPAGK